MCCDGGTNIHICIGKLIIFVNIRILQLCEYFAQNALRIDNNLKSTQNSCYQLLETYSRYTITNNTKIDLICGFWFVNKLLDSSEKKNITPLLNISKNTCTKFYLIKRQTIKINRRWYVIIISKPIFVDKL